MFKTLKFSIDSIDPSIESDRYPASPEDSDFIFNITLASTMNSFGLYLSVLENFFIIISVFVYINIFSNYNLIYIKKIEIMRYLKTFEAHSADPDVKPAPVKPDTKPRERPNRPSPLRRDRPSVEPAPKARKEKEKLKKRYRPSIATAEQVIQRYQEESK